MYFQTHNLFWCYTEQKTEDKVSGVPFKSLLLTSKKKLKDTDESIDDEDVRVNMSDSKATVQDGIFNSILFLFLFFF